MNENQNEIKVEGDFDTFWVMIWTGFQWVKLPTMKSLVEAHKLERDMRQFLYWQRKTYVNRVLDEAVAELDKKMMA